MLNPLTKFNIKYYVLIYRYKLPQKTLFVCVCKLGHMNKTYYYKTCLKVLQYLQEDRSVRNTSQVTTGLRD